MIETIETLVETCMECGEEFPKEDCYNGVCEDCRQADKEEHMVQTWDLADDWYILMMREDTDPVSYSYWLCDSINSIEIDITDTDLGKILDLGVDRLKLEDSGVSIAHAVIKQPEVSIKQDGK